ncbi:MAG: RDD family protein [Tahibacter sp.]
MATEFNPYQTPNSDVGLADSNHYELASKGRRFGTLVLDYVGFFVIGIVLGLVLAIGFGQAGVALLHKTPQLLIGIVITLTYYTFFEGIWGRTPGKFILGTKVVDKAGNKPPLGQIVKRTLCRLIPFEAFSFLGDTGWHDSISDTRVVHLRKR